MTTWIDAFFELERYIDSLDSLPEGKKVIFLDELPWMDAPRSSFLSELEAFWNGWASARKDYCIRGVRKCDGMDGKENFEKHGWPSQPLVASYSFAAI